MEKYQTKTQLLLNILLTDVEEDLELSQQRMNKFIQINDIETLEIEREINNEYKAKKEKIKSLIESEKDCWSSRPSVIKIAVVDADDKEIFLENYNSDLIVN